MAMSVVIQVKPRDRDRSQKLAFSCYGDSQYGEVLFFFSYLPDFVFIVGHQALYYNLSCNSLTPVCALGLRKRLGCKQCSFHPNRKPSAMTLLRSSFWCLHHLTRFSFWRFDLTSVYTHVTPTPHSQCFLEPRDAGRELARTECLSSESVLQ